MKKGVALPCCLLSLLHTTGAVPPEAVRRSQRPRNHAGEVRRNAQLWAATPVREDRVSGATSLLASGAGAVLQPEGQGATLPAAFTWGNVSGVSFLTPIRNQHIPDYCGSCWAFAATSTLSDRWNIASWRARGELPHVMLSTQHVLSCGNADNECGTCQGGDDLAVLEYASRRGIPHESCSNYMARDTTCLVQAGVHGDNRPPCYNCDEKAKCYAIPEFHRLFAKQNSVKRLQGAKAMKEEIFSGGPITCGIMATDKMEHAYSGGVFSERASDSDSRINHVVSVLGWGVDPEGNEYWHARNSWGYEWGEGGFMRIVTSQNKGPAGTGNNLLEEECNYATPDRFATK